MRALTLALTLAMGLLFFGKTPIATAQDAAVPGFDGFYLGGHVGGAVGDAQWTNTGGTSFGPPGTGRSLDPEGLIGGAQAGYMFQFNNFVVGLDLSVSAGDIEDRVAGIFAPDTFTTRIEHLALVQGRLGWALDRWLVFAQGGYAGAQGEAQAVFITVPGTVSREWHNGWTVGGGVLYRFDELFTIGAEYNYVDLGSEGYSSTFAVPDFQSIDHEIHIFKLTASLNLNEFFSKGEQ